MSKGLYKIISIFLAFLIAISAFGICSYAVDASKMSLKVETVYAQPGETIQVKINISNNPGISSLKFNIGYDNNLILTNITFDSAFGTYVTAPTPYSNPQVISMISPMSDIKINGLFATMTFKVSDSAKAGDRYDIKLTYKQDDIFNFNFDDVLANVLNGSVTVDDEATTDKMKISVSSENAEIGDTIQAKINISNNPGISSLKLNVLYDENLTLTNVEFDSAFGTYVTAPTPYSNPQVLNMISPISDITVNGLFATMTFKVSDNAKSGDQYDIALTYKQDDVFNSDFFDIPLVVENGKIIVGHSKGEIIPIEGTNTVIDKENHLIYGLSESIDSIDSFITAKNCEIVLNPSSNGFGTGSTVDLIVDGKLDNTYTILVFGDVTGDAVIDEGDIIVFNLYISWLIDDMESFEDSVNFKAADLSGDGIIDESDLIIMYMVNAWICSIDQTDPTKLIYE